MIAAADIAVWDHCAVIDGRLYRSLPFVTPDEYIPMREIHKGESVALGIDIRPNPKYEQDT